MQSPQAQFKKLLKHLRTRRWESRTVRQRRSYLIHRNFAIGLGACVLLLILGTGFGRWAAIAQIPQASSVVANFSLVQSLVNEPSQLVKAGKEKYQNGEFAPAIALWQKALNLFTKRGERLDQAVVLSNVALGYQQLGQWTQAKAAIAQSIALLKEAKGKDGENSIQNLLADALNI